MSSLPSSASLSCVSVLLLFAARPVAFVPALSLGRNLVPDLPPIVRCTAVDLAANNPHSALAYIKTPLCHPPLVLRPLLA